jgi:CDP-diacylglycerol--glycerol-3-phosphate 3-phosphatidyltransferase
LSGRPSANLGDDSTSPPGTEYPRLAAIEPSQGLANLPNQLTSIRLGLAFVLFALIHFQQWTAALAVFIVAAFTDWLDGHLARKHNLSSSLGRVYDPLVDKVLVLGTFAFFMESRGTGLPGDSGWNAVMLVAVMAREFVVTGLRGFLEERGARFGADRLGKAKMVVQCAAIVWILLAFRWAAAGAIGDWVVRTRDVLNYAAVGLALASGAHYLALARRYLM